LCQPVNPWGIACFAFVVKKEEENTMYREYGVAGEPFTDSATNGITEYTGIIKALEWLIANNSNILIKGDSMLVIHQIKREFKVKAAAVCAQWDQWDRNALERQQ
jgi:ribonuclease HI